jgi:hypothetical protein
LPGFEKPLEIDASRKEWTAWLTAFNAVAGNTSPGEVPDRAATRLAMRLPEIMQCDLRTHEALHFFDWSAPC